MLVAAAVCPQTPLLVPEVAGGASAELADIRKASLDAVTHLWMARPDLLIVLAPGGGAGVRESRLEGTFRRFGVDLAVGGEANAHDASGEPCCGLLVGGWLLDGAFPSTAPACEGWEIGEQTEPEECAKLGRELARRADRVALLAMADGSARRTLKAPGYLDGRAEPFDDEVARALAGADTAALAAIDTVTASDLMAAGRAPLQALAGAAEAVGASAGGDRPWRSELLSYRAPYGVGYFTALWMLEEHLAAGTTAGQP